MSDNKDFFKKQTDSSRVKAAIISEYFPQYCRIISSKHEPQRFGYYDMFAGPGIYDDESWSTPLLLAKNCYDDPFLRDKVWMVFNDLTYGDKLKDNFEKYFQKGTFRFDPHFASKTFGECSEIDSFLTPCYIYLYGQVTHLKYLCLYNFPGIHLIFHITLPN